jgi:hypothetical protein
VGPPRRPASLAAALGLAAALAARGDRGAGAWAAEPPAIAVDLPAAEPLPFTSAELASAVDPRLADAGGTAPGPISLVWVGPDVLEVRAPARRRAVELGGARGAAAARLVALAIVDVVRPQGGGAIAAPAADPGTAQVIAAAPAAPRAPDGSALALAAWTAVNATATSAGLSLEPMVEAAWRLGGDDGQAGGQGVAAQVGYGVGRGVVGGTRFTLHFVPARLGAWAQRGRWRVGGGLSARPYVTAGLDGGAGVLWGGHVDGRATFALGRGFAVLAIAGLEANATAVDFRVGGRSLLRTGRLVPWAGAGLSWGPR